MIKRVTYYCLVLSAIVFSCNNDEQDALAPVEERMDRAIADLRDELVSPSHGWRLLYKPTDLTGNYFMLLDFDEDGEVRVQSDLVENDGEFFDQTIPYRIDAELGLELIFETYGVFHYFFELQQASFGGEFEFVFVGKEDDNLVFESKSDFADKTVIVLEPAGPNEEGLFSRELSRNLNASLFQDPLLTTTTYFQLILEADNVSVFFTLDNQYRLIKANYAAVGTSVEEILSGNENMSLNYTGSYLLQNDAIQLQEPLSFALNGKQYTISSIGLTDFQETQTTYCQGNDLNTHQFSGQIADLGSITMRSSLFTGATDFGSSFYSTDIFYLLDEADESLRDQILEGFPGAAAFQLYYQYDLGDEIFNAVGLVLVDELNNVDFMLREFETVELEGNRLSVTLSDSTFNTREFTETERESLFQLTDQLFEGGEVYALNFPFRNDLHELYNPCNNYKVFLFSN